MTEYKGHIIDVVGRRVFDGVVTVADGRIGSIRECEIPADCKKYIMPACVSLPCCLSCGIFFFSTKN